MTPSTVDAKLARWLEEYGSERVTLGALLCDVHLSDSVALVYDGPAGVQRVTFGELGERSRRLAGALREFGVERGDRVAVMLPKSPELVSALLAIWRLGAVHVPLFTAFGPDAAGYRIGHSGARLVITDAENRVKIGAGGVPVMCVAPNGIGRRPGDLDFAEAVDGSPLLEDVCPKGDELMILLYTSGTTGQPKGVEVPVRSLASVHSYMHYSVDLRPQDVYWNVSDPGWGYGLWYGLIGPLLLGHATLLRGKRFDPEGAFSAIVDHGVTNLTGAPTAYRALRLAGVPKDFRNRSSLRVASSAGEPLNAELLLWSERELGVAIHDHYGQSELGMVVGFPHHPTLHRPPVPGSMGFSAPGFRVAVIGGDGEEVERGADGELAVDLHASPLYWFRGYHRDRERTAERFPYGPRYYLTADSVWLDEHDLLHFASRADDVITSSGYRIGPFEVESALIAHTAVAEVAVIGTPDELRGEAVTAFVVTTPTATPTVELAEELQEHVRSALAKHLCPRHVCFVSSLPRTASGKVERTVLRERWHANQTPP